MTFEEFKNLAAGIQSIVIALGFLTGGVWAIFRFRVFKETEKAKAELDKLKREIAERGVIDVKLNPSVIQNDANKYIKLDMVLENTGNRNEVLDWNLAQVKLARCDWKEDGKRHFCHWQDLLCEFSFGLAGDLVIRPNQVFRFGYISKPISNGVYYIEMNVPTSQETASEHIFSAKAGIREMILWASNTYIVSNGDAQQLNPADSKNSPLI
jgi:hypothetical protein